MKSSLILRVGKCVIIMGELVQTFSELITLPEYAEALLRRDPLLHSACRGILKDAFLRHTEPRTTLAAPLGPLDKIHTSSEFAYDQLWQQLELRNKEVVPFLRQCVSHSGVKRRRVSFDLPHEKQPLLQTKSYNDQFFNLNDMETFAEQGHLTESLAPSSKRSNIADSGDTNSEEEDVEHDDESDEEEEKGLLFSDFFDNPKTSSLEEDVPNEEDDVYDSLEQMNTKGGLDDFDDPNFEATPLQELRKQQHKTISEIEEASVQPKPWHLRGEISAFARPKDSLLDTSMEHDIAVRPKSFISTQISQQIEGLIKQRIVDGLFDDVILTVPEQYEASKKRKALDELPHLSQEKPSEGLAELYAREFADKSKERKNDVTTPVVERVTQSEETEDHKVVNNLFTKLSSRLDALCSINFVGKPVEKNDEVLVTKYKVKSISVEEAVPDAVSDADMLTPHEVFSVNKGELKGPTEMTKQERNAKRLRNKNRGASQRKDQNILQRSASHFDIVEVDKRKGQRALERRGRA